MQECDNRPPGADEVLEALGVRIAHLLIRGLLGIAAASERIEQRAGVDRAIHHMHTRYAEKLTVADLADLAAMSLSHFARVFKQETGRPPLEYLRELRLEKARQLLRGEACPSPRSPCAAASAPRRTSPPPSGGTSARPPAATARRWFTAGSQLRTKKERIAKESPRVEA